MCLFRKGVVLWDACQVEFAQMLDLISCYTATMDTLLGNAVCCYRQGVGRLQPNLVCVDIFLSHSWNTKWLGPPLPLSAKAHDMQSHLV